MKDQSIQASKFRIMRPFELPLFKIAIVLFTLVGPIIHQSNQKTIFQKNRKKFFVSELFLLFLAPILAFLIYNCYNKFDPRFKKVR